MSHLESWVRAAPAGQVWQVPAAAGTHHVLPDGVLDLVWSADELLFCGPDSTGYQVTYDGDTTVWGFRFAPGAAAALLGIPAQELLDARLDATELLRLPGSAVDAVADDPAAGLRLAAKLLWDRVEVDRAGLRLAASIDRDARAGLDVRAIAARHHLSERTLRRYSHRTFGYGTKTLASVHRFQRALDLARSGTSLADAAVSAGYSDQTHLARETRRLAGTTMTALLS